jgi:hypothetical protein
MRSPTNEDMLRLTGSPLSELRTLMGLDEGVTILARKEAPKKPLEIKKLAPKTPERAEACRPLEMRVVTSTVKDPDDGKEEDVEDAAPAFTPEMRMFAGMDEEDFNADKAGLSRHADMAQDWAKSAKYRGGQGLHKFASEDYGKSAENHTKAAEFARKLKDEKTAAKHDAKATERAALAKAHETKHAESALGKRDAAAAPKKEDFSAPWIAEMRRMADL